MSGAILGNLRDLLRQWLLEDDKRVGPTLPLLVSKNVPSEGTRNAGDPERQCLRKAGGRKAPHRAETRAFSRAGGGGSAFTRATSCCDAPQASTSGGGNGARVSGSKDAVV